MSPSWNVHNGMLVLFFIFSRAGTVVLGHKSDQCVTVVIDDCSPWFYSCNGTGQCEFCDKPDNDIIKSSNGISELKLGFCMTGDNSSAYIMSCPYDIAEHHLDLLEAQLLMINTTAEELNNFTCSQLNRYGRHCAQCMSNYGQSIFTMDLKCFPCSIRYGGWGLYFFLELVPLTIFVVVILVLQISPTKPNMKAFVLFSQVTALFLTLNYEQPYKHIFGEKMYMVVRVTKAFYGIWNLDFFRSLIPPFCVSRGMNNLEVLSFQYISVIYPVLLIFVAWVFVDLHERNFRPFVRMWKPFRRYLSHYSVTTDPKRVIISFLATMVILSYTKVIYISALLLDIVKEYRVCNDYSQVLFLQPDIPYYKSQHAPFVVLSTAMLVLFVILPLLLLLLYPIDYFQDKLKSFCVRENNIQMFAEAFYGCYNWDNSGDSNTRDCRLVSTLYLFLRIIFAVIFVRSERSIIAYILAAVVHGIVIGLFCVLKPYKKEAYNYLDLLLLTVYAVALLFAAFVTNNSENKKLSVIIFVFIFLAMITPLLYASIYVSVLLIKWLKGIDMRPFMQRRRRGYVEIDDYGETSVNESERSRRVEGRRTRGGGASVKSK